MKTINEILDEIVRKYETKVKNIIADEENYKKLVKKEFGHNVPDELRFVAFPNVEYVKISKNEEGLDYIEENDLKYDVHTAVTHLKLSKKGWLPVQEAVQEINNANIGIDEIKKIRLNCVNRTGFLVISREISPMTYAYMMVRDASKPKYVSTYTRYAVSSYLEYSQYDGMGVLNLLNSNDCDDIEACAEQFVNEMFCAMHLDNDAENIMNNMLRHFSAKTVEIVATQILITYDYRYGNIVPAPWYDSTEHHVLDTWVRKHKSDAFYYWHRTNERAFRITEHDVKQFNACVMSEFCKSVYEYITRTVKAA